LEWQTLPPRVCITRRQQNYRRRPRGSSHSTSARYAIASTTTAPASTGKPPK
ncbi:hypothetical protein PF006_g23915, partial [Phytophthora fragariae]